MSLKLKLISILALFTLMLGVLIMGVFAVTQNIGLKGSISFNVPDKSLFVKDIRVQTEVTGKAETIDNFMPGYLNENFVLDLGTVESESGTIGLYFDIVNTTDLRYEITNISLPETLTSQGIIASDSGIIEVNNLTDTDGDNYKEITDVATAPYDTLTLLITTSNASANLSIALDGTVITIDEYLVEYTDFAFARTSDSTGAITAYTGSATEVEIPATFSVKTEQLSTSGYTVRLEDFENEFYNYIMDKGGYNQIVLMSGFYKVTSDGMESDYIKDGYTFLMEAMGGQIQFPITIEFTDYEVTYQDFTSLEYAEYAIMRPIYELMLGNIESVTMEFGTQAKYEINAANVEDVLNGEDEEIIINLEDESFYPVKFSYPKERIIPVEGEDYQVTSIGAMALYGSSLTSITIPERVTSIGFGAFSGCSGLTSISIPEGVTSIGSSTFEGCSSLTGDLVIPEGVTSIGSSTFSGCSSLTSITIPEGVTYIGSSAFSGCRGLTSITIPEGVTSIGYSAFEGCSSLTEMNYLGTLTDWCAIDFGSDDSNPTYWTGALYIQEQELTTLNIPEGVISIGSYAFYNCGSLTGDLVIPEGVTSIGSNAFDGCSGLTNVSLPNTLTSIGFDVFSGCNSSIYYVENGASYLGNESNPYMYLADVSTTATEYTINNNTKFIGDDAFFGNSTLTSLIIPEGITSIGSQAFSYCDSLTSITIPASVTNISSSAFLFCDNLTTVTINEYIYTEATSEYSCGDILQKAQTVYVPEELVNNLALTMGDYLQNNFTQGELANGLYTYTKNQ